MNRLTSGLLGLCLLAAGGVLSGREWRRQSAAIDGDVALQQIVADQAISLHQAQEQVAWYEIRRLEGLGYLGKLRQPVTLPFHYVGKHILVTAQIPAAQQTADLILDTGVRSPLLDWKLASQISLSNPLRLDPQASYGVLDYISLGDAYFHQMGTFAIEFSEPGQPLHCLSKYGAIGGNLMRHGVWQIDYVNHTLTIADDIADFNLPPGAIALPFDLMDSRPLVTLDVGAGVVIQALLDTGWNGSIHLSAHDIQKLPSTEIRTTATVESLVESLKGLAVTRQQTVQLSQLVLGGLRLEYFPVSVDVGTPLQPTSLIGNDFLEHFVVTLDYPNQQLYLMPIDANTELYPLSPAYGFQTMVRGNRLLVTGLYYPSAAAQAGLQIGDQIVSINGDRYTDLTDQPVCQLIHHPVSDRYTGSLQMTLNRSGRLLSFSVRPNRIAHRSLAN